MIYFKKCKIPYPHDFPDHPCKKCNAFIIIDKEGIEIDKNKLRNIIYIAFIILSILADIEILK